MSVSLETQKQIWDKAFSILDKSKWAIIGISVAIGCLGLVLGGITVLVTYLLMQVYTPDHFFMPMLPSMIAGFLGFGISGLTVGLLFARATLKKLDPR